MLKKSSYRGVGNESKFERLGDGLSPKLAKGTFVLQYGT